MQNLSDQELIQKLHRTWVQFLINSERKDCAAIIVDAELSFEYGWDEYNSCNYISGLIIFLPFNLMLLALNNEEILQYLKNTFLLIASGHIWNDMQGFPLYYRVQLLEIEDNWQKPLNISLLNQKI